MTINCYYWYKNLYVNQSCKLRKYFVKKSIFFFHLDLVANVFYGFNAKMEIFISLNVKIKYAFSLFLFHTLTHTYTHAYTLPHMRANTLTHALFSNEMSERWSLLMLNNLLSAILPHKTPKKSQKRLVFFNLWRN